MKTYSPTDRLTALITHNPLILMAMSRFGISLGFGDKSVEQVCHEQGIDCKTFLAVVNYISFGTIDIDNVSPAALMQYLAEAHTYFLDYILPKIRRNLLDAIDCSGRNEVAMLILQFYDAYVEEVHRHMEYENSNVFTYVTDLLNGVVSIDYSIDVFASNHHEINSKLKDLKNIIIRYLPQKDDNRLNSVLFDIINCEQDLISHCRVEDCLFVPVVKRLEDKLRLTPTHQQPKEPEPDEAADAISPREREIIECVARGLSNKEIADRLCISVNTVTTHRRNLAQKLQIHSPAGLAIYAVINGIVDINDLKA